MNGKDFGNYKKGKVVIEKVNAGGTQSDAFPFTTQGLGGPFDLAATDAAGRQVTDVVPNIKPGAPTYSVTEGTGAPADRYTLTALDCDDTDSTQDANQATLDTRTATVKVSSGETVTCTFTNTRKTGKLELVKQLEPAGDGGRFDLLIDGAAEATAVGDEGTTGEKTLPTGSHTVAEAGANGTDLSDYATTLVCKDGNGAGTVVPSPGGTVDVTAGSDVVCTITNKRAATMKVVKQVINPAGAVDAQKAFEFTPDDALFLEGAEVGVFSLKHGESRGPKSTFAFGSGFAVSETASPEYTTTSSCTGDLPGGSDSSGEGSTVTFVPDPGENLVCTVVNTRKTGTLEVRKELEGEGLFDLQIDGATESGADGVGDGGTSGPKLVETGSHDVNELGHGVDLADYVVSTTCADDGHPIETTGSGKGALGAVTVDVQPGHALVCVIRNVERATVTIVKEVVGGDDDKLFEFTPNAALTGASEPDPALVDGKFELEDGGSQRFGRVVPDDGGSYKVTETAEPGYRLTAIECDDDDSTDESSVDGLAPLTATINVDAGEDVTCTFTNTRNAAIEIEKVNVGGAPADEFEFDPSADLGVESIALDQDGNWTMTGGDEQVFGEVVPNAGRSAYTVAELVPAGYRLTGIECDHGNTSKTSAAGFDGEAATATIEVAAGQTVHCTFTNTRNGSLTVVKRVAGDPQGQKFAFSPSDELVTVGGEEPALQPGDTVELLADGSEVFPGLIPNDEGGKSYTVDETVPAGYRLTDIDCDGSSDDQDATNLDGIDRGAVVKVAAGEDVTCEFTNTKDATIKIAKVNVGGPEDDQFAFDASSDFGARSVTYALDADDKWSMTGGQTQELSGVVPNAGHAGRDYSVKELVPEHYRLTAIECDGDNTGKADPAGFTGDAAAADIVVAPGATVLCTFTNTRNAKVTIVKEVVGAPAADAGKKFAFTAADELGANAQPAGPKSFVLGDGEHQDYLELIPNSPTGDGYGVSEDVPAGYRLTSIECDGENGSTSVSDAKGVDPEATIKVAAGEHVTCTYTNTKDSSITIRKEAVGGEEGDSFGFSASDGLADAGRTTADPMLVEGGFTLEDGESQGFAGVVPDGDGAYTVTEDVPAGWRLTKIACDDDDSTDESSNAGLEGHTATVKLDAGEDVVCTFTNTRNATIKVTKVVEGGDDGDRFAFDASSAFGSSGTSIPLGAGETWSLGAGDTQTFANAQPNDYDGGPEYAVAETGAPDGYRLTRIDCSNEASTNVADADGLTDPATIVAAPGETVECTFTNTKRGTIEIEKQTDPDEADENAKVFTFTGSDALAGELEPRPEVVRADRRRRQDHRRTSSRTTAGRRTRSARPRRSATGCRASTAARTPTAAARRRRGPRASTCRRARPCAARSRTRSSTRARSCSRRARSRRITAIRSRTRSTSRTPATRRCTTST